MACLETDEVFVVWLLDWRCGLDSKKTTYKSNESLAPMEKIAKKKKKKKTKTPKKTDQIDILRLKQSFFCQDCVQSLIFCSNLDPVPTNSEIFETAYCFIQIRVDSGERLQKHAVSVSRFTGFVRTKGKKIKQYLTSEKCDSLGPKLSALQL